ncbi:uncharacterized protein F4822DRAFT_104246 [Hypoxylon trugodes]|uniref:uncharacterized protein n=1 Tax=Hypoxylon trugodes TaxID=326681 RepID=UPI00219F300F|nr:uncharacterized protein F4822DRAFT_104246 [Hypoxylon trugodes]KAI1382597.1 hypothetical protein F4822DRAFT_104246 [Hypoxylon trugodes]
MVPPEAQRKFAFDGTDLEYIRYLEEHVARLQRQLSNQTSPVQQNWLPRKPQPPSEFVLISSSKFGNQHQNHDKNNNLDLSVQLGPHVNRFLTPIANNDKEWLEKRKRTGINTPSQYLRIFLGLIRTSDLTTSVGTGLGPGTRAKPIDIIRDYCTFASSLQQNAEQETQVSRLATLLFLGICCVSLEVGVDMDTVDNYIKTFLRKPKTSSVYCSRLRKASKWAGQLMEKLEEVLGRRSSELFLLCEYFLTKD